MQLHPDQVLDVIMRGERAASLMANTDFVAVVDDMTNYHLAALVAAPPGPRGLEAREHHHLMQHALSDIVATLKGQVDTGEAMKRALEAHEEDDL